MLLWRASGRIGVARDGTPIVLARQPQRLIAGLLVARGSPVDPTNLAERLWDEPGRGSAAALRVTVNRLRRQLGSDCRLSTVGAGYQLDVDQHSLDLWQFEHHVGQAAARAPAQQVSRLRAALNLWEGPP